MTWLSGISTWADIVDDLTKLACGEIADDNAVTCDVGDRWVRHIGGQDLLRTPTSEDVNTGAVSFRAGYFSLMTHLQATAPNTYSWQQDVCKVTSVWTGTPTGVLNGRWMINVYLRTANTVNGNYSTAKVQWTAVNVDNTGGTILQSNPSGTAGDSPSSTGDLTITFGTKSLVVNIANPATGFLQGGTLWTRIFTTTYLGGIDYHGPFFRRRSGAATYSVNPPGTITTDYDVEVDVPSTAASFNPIWNTVATTIQPTVEFGYYGCGVGIKTNAGLGSPTGSLYTCSWDMALWTLRIDEHPSTAGVLQVYHNTTLLNDSGTYRRAAGTQILTALVPFVTPALVLSTSQIQYWMSVKSNKLIIILNGDPGNTGQLTDFGVWSFTPHDYFGGGYDKFPIVGSSTSQTSGSSALGITPATYLQQVIRQDTSAASFPAGRDWQTRWGRNDTAMCEITTSGPSQTDQGNGLIYFTSGATIVAPGGRLNTAFGAGSEYNQPLLSTKPIPFTGKWRMYGVPLSDTDFGGNVNVVTEANWDYPRGYIPGNVNSPFLLLPGTGWASGDELTDTASGNVWFCVEHGSGSVGILSFGMAANRNGIAVLEE